MELSAFFHWLDCTFEKNCQLFFKFSLILSKLCFVKRTCKHLLKEYLDEPSKPWTSVILVGKRDSDTGLSESLNGPIESSVESPIESQCSNASRVEKVTFTPTDGSDASMHPSWTFSCRLRIEICIAWRFDPDKRFFGGFISSEKFSDISVIAPRLRMLTWFRVIIQK